MSCNKKVLAIFECTPQIGYGHASRSISLLRLFYTLGFKGVLLTSCESKLMLDNFFTNDFGLTVHYSLNDFLSDPLELYNLFSPNILLIDHYDINIRNFLPALSHLSITRILFDDIASSPDYPCNVFINPNLYPSSHSISQNCLHLIGPSFMPLREEFIDIPSHWRPSASSDEKYRCLISVGATDPLNLTSVIIDKLQSYPHSNEFIFSIVLSSLAPRLQDLCALLDSISSNLTTELLLDAVNMSVLYLNSHCCIGAAGSSSWERASIGLPTAQFPIVDNQQNIQNSLSSHGAIFNLDIPTSPQFSSQIFEFLDSALNVRSDFLDLSSSSLSLGIRSGASNVVKMVSLFS